MSSKFFNNYTGHTLFDKLKGIAINMANFDRFLAVVGFFRSSGYFKLRKELNDVEEIKILVGINIDDIFRRHNKAMLMLENEEKAKMVYDEEFRQDIVNARYAPEVEEGILQMCQDLVDGRLQMKIHATKNLHAKFYLCLPHSHNENTDGWVIMGSSNISDSGLGTTQSPRYELNVAMKDFDDVDYCHSEFKKLWEEAVTLTIDDVESIKQKTYLGYQPTPYEIYLKVLIDTFGDQIEDDFSIQLPNGVMELKYQTDAVIQGFQMLMRHNGLFLADVVGLGKTMIATMIVKRFIEANGKNTSILVVFPPALRENWENTFKLFGIKHKAQFITNGKLSSVLDGKEQYKAKEEFDLIIVDEAHGFRNDGAGKYDELQKICKADCVNAGLLKSQRKKVMLLSATPLNNRPDDLLNLLLLFQDSQNCTIDGIPNLKAFFAEYIKAYRILMKERETRDVTADVDKIYEDIRERVIDKVTVRRTRHNIENDPEYKKDLQTQGIIFPKPQPPISLEYKMDTDTSQRFFYTLNVLSDDKFDPHLYYARYRAVEFLKPEYRAKYRNAVHVGQTLAGIYRVHMVKRLESSFHAFKLSLATLLRITNDMLKMFAENKVIIAPELNVKELQAKGMELDQIIELAMKKGYQESDILYKSDDFEPDFIEMLRHDKQVLEALNADWQKEHDDQKFDLFRQKLETEFFDSRNVSGKLVVFSESVDTLNYLKDRLEKELGRKDVLTITAENRDKKELIQHVMETIAAATAFLKEHDFELDELIKAESFEKLSLLKEAANVMCETAEIRKSYCTFASTLLKLWKYLDREDITPEMKQQKDAIEAIYKELQQKRKHADITDLSVAINEIVNEHLEVDSNSTMVAESRRFDISGIDFELLRREFVKSKEKNLVLKDIQDLLQERIAQMLAQNPSRINFYEKYQEIINDYNQEQNRATIEKTFEELMKLSHELTEEEKRYIREGFENDEQLSMYDVLMKDDLSKEDIKKLKVVAKDLLEKIKAQLATMDHPFDKQETRASIIITIRDILWKELPESYTDESINYYRDAVYNYVSQHYGSVA